jgi:hypothetical protein
MAKNSKVRPFVRHSIYEVECRADCLNRQSIETKETEMANTNTKKNLKFVYRGSEKFCASEEQHEYVFVYAPYLSSGKSYDCIYCDDFQVS